MTVNYALPKIAITTGDPAGIGPEICAHVLSSANYSSVCQPIVFGDFAVLTAAANSLALELDCQVLTTSEFKDLAEANKLSPSQRYVVDFQNDAEEFPAGQVSAAAGRAAFEYIDFVIAAHQANLVQGMVTGPINKLSLHAAGFNYPGHTELLAEKTNVEDFCMLQYSPVVSCSFVTTHCGYAEVVELLDEKRILKVIELTDHAMTKILGRPPRLITCGLNPHAGEDGLFGNREEERIIVPAINKAQAIGIEIAGPFPPDTCFIPKRRAEFDCVVCMYHDQGHIPLKALAFDQAVNTTLGLPIIRTSVDHGTAFDIVGKNEADPSSLMRAIELAAKLAGRCDRVVNS